MNKLTTIERAQILTALVEGNSMASTSRMFRVSKITILRLLADAGTLALDYHNEVVRNLESKHVQLDEIWSFVNAKEKNVQPKNWGKLHGSVWTWVALDADSKLVINWSIGGRDSKYGREFVADLADRLTERTQITTDGFAPYRDAIKRAFGDDVDFAQLVKIYTADRGEHARYSPPVCVAACANVQTGNPDVDHINTSYVERQNLTMRMQMRRFTRLTNAFSKKIENHRHAVALHYFHYNFVRKHMTLGTTPAFAANVTDREWTMVDFVRMLERTEAMRGGRLTNYKMSASKRQSA